MKFDKIIMNPPYGGRGNGDLHLKILANAISHLSENGTCVNLSPVRWLQDPFAENKPNSDFNIYEESIRKHIEDVQLINKMTAQKYFDGTVMGMDLGIYTCKFKTDSCNFDFDNFLDSVIKKVLAKHLTSPIFDEDKKDGWRVRIPKITNNGGSGNNRKTTLAGFGRVLYFHNGKTKDGKPWHEAYGKNQYSSKYTDLIQQSIHFDSEIEAKNFCDSYDHKEMKTIFAAYVTSKLKCDINVTPQVILWMGDAINPRTGKKGYKSKWTDEDFYTYFNITKAEQKLIEETMEKYK